MPDAPALGRRPAQQVLLEPGGPLIVEGPVEVVLPDGTTAYSDRCRVAVCTCRRSRSYPWCDTSHRGHRGGRIPRRGKAQPPEDQGQDQGREGRERASAAGPGTPDPAARTAGAARTDPAKAATARTAEPADPAPGAGTGTAARLRQGPPQR